VIFVFGWLLVTSGRGEFLWDGRAELLADGLFIIMPDGSTEGAEVVGLG